MKKGIPAPKKKALVKKIKKHIGKEIVRDAKDVKEDLSILKKVKKK